MTKVIASDASPWVRRHAAKIAAAAETRPILDVACGSGRNAHLLRRYGARIVGVDIDTRRTTIVDGFDVRRHDLDADPWPFQRGELGGIIQIHFLRPALFGWFAFSLAPGGYLLVETVPGHGGNYLELPKEGELRMHLEQDFAIEEYRERPVGPASANAVTAHLLARRKGLREGKFCR